MKINESSFGSFLVVMIYVLQVYSDGFCSNISSILEGDD